jgi:SH3-like domain-containing protein
MHAALLSGTRTAIVAPWLKPDVALLGDRRETAALLALISRALLNIDCFDGHWCNVNIAVTQLLVMPVSRALGRLSPRNRAVADRTD